MLRDRQKLAIEVWVVGAVQQVAPVENRTKRCLCKGQGRGSGASATRRACFGQTGDSEHVCFGSMKAVGLAESRGSLSLSLDKVFGSLAAEWPFHVLHIGRN